MKELLKNFARLVKVKSIVTFCVVAVWMVLALTGREISDSVNTLVLMVISFYFGTQTEKRERE